ncbi:hypothetical protein CALVIDRAFT_527801 [Calocera viscosa TUFC12733]|uniref:Uncharacterized protein n=1 Tax=Calocera viscosa (strain TUFC12733) TaxID=1330018 RepID=A0A167LUN1_CALVF|nr:hypothetical protein CALVIDRAFT_527801 [Calocera viscosa TUFC12733]
MSTAATVKPLDVWVNDLVDLIFFQPDDEVAIKSFEESISPDIHIDVNGKILTRAAYLGLVHGYRKESVGTNLSNPTLVMAVSDAEKQTGTVAQCGKFSTVNKATGKDVRATGVTLCKVEWVNGKRVLTSLTEVQADD